MWGQRIFDFYALVNATQWASQYGQRFDASQLPFLVLPAEGQDRSVCIIALDALEREREKRPALELWDLALTAILEKRKRGPKVVSIMKMRGQ